MYEVQVIYSQQVTENNTPQIFPVEIRARGNCLSMVINWSLNLVFSLSAPIALEFLGFGFFFFAWNLVAAVCYILFFPESRNRTPEQMAKLFGNK